MLVGRATARGTAVPPLELRQTSAAALAPLFGAVSLCKRVQQVSRARDR